MAGNLELIKKLREASGAGISACQKALKECGDDYDKAFDFLRKQGISKASSKADRATSEGLCCVASNANGIAVVKLSCETDFVAKNETFQKLAKDICMHIAAMSPLYISPEEIPSEIEDKERSIAMEQCAGKPEKAIEKIVAGKLAKWHSEVCLLNQPFVKEQEHSVGEYIAQAVANIGENIKIGRFVRYQLGQ